VYDGQAEVGVALTVDELVVDEVQSAQGSELVVVVVDDQSPQVTADVVVVVVVGSQSDQVAALLVVVVLAGSAVEDSQSPQPEQSPEQDVTVASTVVVLV